MEIQVTQHPGLACKFEVYDDMKILVDTINSKIDTQSDISFKLGLVDCGYHFSPEEFNRGIYGYYGCAGVGIGEECEKDNRKSFSKDTETLIITIKDRISQDWIDTHKDILEKLVVTPGGHNNTMKPYSLSESLTSIQVKYGVYKKPHFDELFSVITKLVPHIKTELDLAKYALNYEDDTFNLHFVTRDLYHGDDNCLCTYDVTTMIPTEPKKFTLTLQIIGCDIQPNMSTLLELITSLYH